MSDDLFSETWPRINVEKYIEQHRLTFDGVDLKMLPDYTLIDKIKVVGLLAAMLLNDPLKQKREQLNKAILTEVQRQTALLVAEYNWRIEQGLVVIDSQVKIFLGKHIELLPPDPNGKPPPVVIGMKTLELVAKQG